jgi:hypothetical protein
MPYYVSQREGGRKGNRDRDILDLQINPNIYQSYFLYFNDNSAFKKSAQ